MITLGLYAIPLPPDTHESEVHDHSLVLMNNGRVIEFLELERYTRRKHDNQLPLYLDQLVGKHAIKDLRVIFVDSYAGRKISNPNGNTFFFAEDPNNLFNRPLLGTGKWNGNEVETWVCNHELAHIGSHLLFCGGFEENSLLVHIDGGASLSNCSVWLFRGGSIRLLHHSWDLHKQAMNFSDNPLSHAILNSTKKNHLDIAGKLMGYAGYGHATPELKDWLTRNEWFRNCQQNMDLFFEAAATDHKWKATEFDQRDPFLMDIAACMQEDLEETVERFIFSYQEKTGAKYLYYSGGTALNINTNSRLENSGRFNKVYIPPCCNDSGLSLGASALFELQEGKRIEHHNPFLNSFGLDSYRYNPQFNIVDIAQRIADGQVIGVCVGHAEVGPRALGHRSLIAHPFSRKLRDRISIEMKQREWYRPIAPMVLKREANNLFEGAASSSLSRYMLGSFLVRSRVREQIEAVVHADGTARVQVVDEDEPSLKLIINLLTVLKERFSIPCVINTSFNSRGEPIVHTKEDALRSAWQMGVDAVIFNNELLINSDHHNEERP